MNSSDAQPMGSLATAVAHAARLLGPKPGLAEAQAREILTVAPKHLEASRILACALRAQDRPLEAVAILEPLAGQPEASPDLLYELALAWADSGRNKEAIKTLRHAAHLQEQHP